MPASDRRCFVISPIGAESSPTREHADDVFDYIIKPAMEACGIEAIRSDRLQEPGKISDHMFREILDDDLSIAVLTFFNPNVFYELAIAQAAARPVIILLEKGNVLPFDIQDLRCVYYDLKPRALFERTYVDEIVGHVRSLDTLGWQSPSPFGPLMDAGRAVRLYARADDFGGHDEWMGLLRETNDGFDIMGVSLDSWRQSKGFTELLKAKAVGGCRVRALIMHKENLALQEMNNRNERPAEYAKVLASIDAMNEYFSGLATSNQNIQIRTMRHGCPHWQLTRSDRVAVGIQYFYSLHAAQTPMWRAARGTDLYDAATQEFTALWELNAPP